MSVTDLRARRPRVLHLTTVDMSLALLLGPQLAAFERAGFEVIGASAPGPYREQIEATGARFVPLHHATRAMRPHRDLLALIELVRLARRLRPDILHTHNPKPGWYGRLAARLAGVPHVVNTVHGLYALPEDPPLKRHVVYTLERLAARCSDAELVQNPEDIETLRSLGVPDSKLHDLGNGIDLDRFAPSAVDPAVVARVRAELLGDRHSPSGGRDARVASSRSGAGGGDGVVLVGVVGRLVWEKGLREILDAGARLQERVPQVRIVIVGPTDPDKSDGLTEADLDRLSAQSGVRFAGERSDMAEVHAAFDLFVLATHREGFPRAAMEATAMGVPVIATNIRGCRQVVDDGTTGLLVPVRDSAALAAAIEELATDPARRVAMSSAGVERARKQFDQRRQIELTLDVYHRLLGERDRRPRVLHLVTSDARRGAEVAARQLVDQLAEEGVVGELHALAPASGTEAGRLSIPTIGPTARSPRTLLGVRRLARSHDVVVAHGSDTLLVTALATIGLDVPFVYQMIGDPEVWGEVALAGARIGTPLRRAAAVVVLWADAGRSIRRRYGVSPDRIHVIPNSRDAEHFRPPTADERARARRTFGVENRVDAGPVIAWIGAFTEEKRPELAVDVAAELTGSTLLMAGDGMLRDRVATVGSTYGVDLRMLGVIDDVRSLLWAADVLLITSRTEGMPGVAVEALLCRTPVAAPAIGALPDLLGADHPGLCEPVDTATRNPLPGRVDLTTTGAGFELARAVVASIETGRGEIPDLSRASGIERWSNVLERTVPRRSATIRTRR